jgi:hypothetical protein
LAASVASRGRSGERDLVVGHVADLGGAEILSDAQISLIKRAATLEAELERLDAMLSRGELVNLDEYGRATSHLRRLFETLGIERRAKDITPPSPMRQAVERQHRRRAAATAASAITIEAEPL